jgi:hypothetical protein
MVRMALIGQSLTIVRKTLLSPSLLHMRATQNVFSSSSMPRRISGTRSARC